jgi:hypothetical protein
MALHREEPKSSTEAIEEVQGTEDHREDARDVMPGDEAMVPLEDFLGHRHKRLRADTDTADDAGDPTVYQKFPSPCVTYGLKRNRWQRMRDERLDGCQERWGGFANQGEWELARWLVKAGLSQHDIDAYLKLPMVSDN